MSQRRGLALVMTVTAMATVISGTAAALGATPPASPRHTTTICVALVVDGRALGSDVSTSCAKMAKGSTGVDALQAGGHHVGFRHDGLVCTIDGLPKSGCSGVDDTHYWAYFHRVPGTTTWTYSSEGPSTYQPADDSTDGWVYDDGTALTPQNIAYAKICPPDISPVSKASASPTPHKTASPTATAASATPTSHATTAPPTRAPSKPPKPPHRSTTPTHRASASSSPSTSASSAALAGAVPPPPQHHGWLGLLIGLAAVAALGIAAAVRFRGSER